MRQTAVRRRLRRRRAVMRWRGEFSAGVGIPAVPSARIRRRVGCSALGIDIRISVHILRGLRGCLSLSCICLVLCEMMIIRGCILIRPLPLGLRGDKASVRPLRIGTPAGRGSHLRRRLPSGLGCNLLQQNISDEIRELPTVHGFVHFSPVMNGCILACCGVHRSMGFMFRSP